MGFFLNLIFILMIFVGFTDVLSNNKAANNKQNKENIKGKSIAS